MPIYEYRCKSCGQVEEFLESGGAVEEHSCGKCGRAGMEKIFSAFGVEVGRGSAPPPPSCASGGCSGGVCPYN